MGFGFNLLVIFVVAPLTVILLIVAAVTRTRIPLYALGAIWLGIIGLVLLVAMVDFFTGPTRLSRSDIYGEYVIDRSKFPGVNADWQYDHFRFEITEDDSIHFHVTDNKRIVRTYSGTVSFVPQHATPRLIIAIDTPRHHIIEEKPTLYRKPHSFYYVFKSPYFGNVFFRKGEWEVRK